MDIDTLSPTRRVAVAAAGPVFLGAVLSARLGAPEPIVALPLIVAGLTALTVPALYIASAAIGAAAGPGVILAAVGRALASLGAALCGLAVPLAFLAGTASATTGVVLGALALVVATGFALGTLHRALFAGQTASFSRDLLFAVWAIVALGIGARMYVDVAAWGAS
jgi:hypothetical protein